MDQTQQLHKRNPILQSKDPYPADRESNKHKHMGEANLCMNKWKDPTYPPKHLANEILGTLAQCGIKMIELGSTYLADRLSPEVNVIESTLDHIYASEY